VLVTCTDGGCGDDTGGIKPGQAGFNREAVIAQRQLELAHSCQVLGIHDQVNLGYPDSGMMGWPQNDEPGSFWSTPVDEAAERLAELMRQYQPQVVVTYDANGFYGHPDHIQAHRITLRAAELTGIPSKVYYTAVPKSRMLELGRRMAELGVEFPRDADADGEPEASTEEVGPREEWGTPDEEVTTYVDVSKAADRKYESLMAHASQSDNIFFLQMGRPVFAEIMGSEAFVRAVDHTDAPVPEDDLFAGLR
jgi:LmbE family N-acetylglucosaminyl deacetylase